MKKFLSLMAIALVIVACGNDDDSSENSEASIVGAFVLVEMNLEEPIDLDENGTSSSNLLDEAPCFDSLVTFSANQTYEASSDVLEVFFTSDSEGNESITVDCFGPFDETGTYTLEGNVLTINEDEDNTDEELSIDSGTVVITQQTLTLTTVTPFGIIEFVYNRI